MGSGARAKRAGHALDAVDERAAQQLRLASLDVWDQAQHLAEDRRQLGPRQRCTHAVVRSATTKPEMVVRAAADVELPRAFERALVSVARVVEQNDLLPGREPLAVELDLARSGAPERHHWRGPPNELLDGIGKPRIEVSHQQSALGGMQRQGTDRVRSRVARGVVAR